MRPDMLPKSEKQTAAPEAPLGANSVFHPAAWAQPKAVLDEQALELRVNGGALDLAVGGFVGQRPRLDEASPTALEVTRLGCARRPSDASPTNSHTLTSGA